MRRMLINIHNFIGKLYHDIAAEQFPNTAKVTANILRWQ